MTLLLERIKRKIRAGSWRKPYFHDSPMVPAAVAALAGVTLANVTAMILVTFLGFCGLAVAFRSRPERRVLREGSWTRMALAITFFILGSARGFQWKQEMAWAERVSSSGPYQAVFVPLEAVQVGGQSETAYFKGRLASLSFLEGQDVPQRLAGEGCLVEVFVMTRDIPSVNPGIPLQAIGRFQIPAVAMNPGEFNRRSYLAGERTFVEFQSSQAAKLPERSAPLSLSLWFRLVGLARSRLLSVVDASLPGDESVMLKGLLVGERSDMPDDIAINMKRSGLYRFATVAGFHIDLAFAMTYTLLRRATKKPSLSRATAAFVAFSYAAMSGFTAGAIRALVCACMRAWAAPARCRYDPLAGLSVAAVVSAWFIPFPLSNAGFLLTFSAALGSYVAQTYGPMIGFPRFKIPSPVLRTVGIFLFLLPQAAFWFQEVSIAGFFLSAVWTGVMGIIIPMSLAIIACPITARALGWLPYLALRGLRETSSWVAALPGSFAAVPAPWKAEVAAYYGLIGLFVWWCSEKRLALSAEMHFEDALHFDRREIRWRLRFASALVFCGVLIGCGVLRAYLPWPEVTFISVGQGDCALIRYKTSAVLVDTGTAEQFLNRALPYLRRLGVTHIDACVLSHLHDDHAGGLRDLCRNLRVSAVICSTSLVAPVQRLLGQVTEPQVIGAEPGSVFEIGGTDCLTLTATYSPSYAPVDDAENDGSLVAVVTAPVGFTTEFWGDATSESAAASLTAYPSCLALGPGMSRYPRVVKVPHHGSRYSIAPGFYERLTGSVAVVSVGLNVYGHPSQEMLRTAERCGVQVKRTDVDGAVVVRCILGRTWVQTFVRAQAGIP